MQPVIIGISSCTKKIATHLSIGQNVSLVPLDYFTLFSEENAIPLAISSFISLSHLDILCAKLNGLFLSGGEDIDPSFYHENPRVEYGVNIPFMGTPFRRPELMKPDRKRDQFEIALYLAAKKRGLPILGNCRGMQIINVAEGGSLDQEIPPECLNHLISEDGWANYHEVAIDPSSRWGTLLERSLYTTSSCHHQAIKQLAPSLQAAGKAPDGIIEMIEHKNLFILGIQGHIEKITTNFIQYQRVIKEFIKQC